MQRARQQLLAGAAFAEQERRHVGRRDLLDHAAHGEHDLAGRDDAVERRSVDLQLQATVLRFELGDVERPVDEQLERVGVDGLLVEVVGALADGRQRVLLVAVAGDDDDFRVRRELEDLAERQQAFLDAFGPGRQTEILQDDGRFVPAQLHDRARTVLGGEDFVVLEAPFELAEEARIVLDDQQFTAVPVHT